MCKRDGNDGGGRDDDSCLEHDVDAADDDDDGAKTGVEGDGGKGMRKEDGTVCQSRRVPDSEPRMDIIS